jgi:processive 1,2-diacylglycerol beta-glucosyltransferase
MNKVLILTSGYGEGHNAAARNLAAALDRLAGPGTAVTVDLFAEVSPRLHALTRRLYLALINRTPRVWSSVYRWLDHARPFPRELRWLRRATARLDSLLQTHRPFVVCSTYPLYGFMLDELAAAGRLPCPHVNIVTDSISINSLWWLPDCQSWYVPNADTAHVLLDAGRPAGRIFPLGFPVPEILALDTPDLQPPNLAVGHAPRVLYIVNSGSHHAAQLGRLLLAEPSWNVTCAVGRDHRLREHLEALARQRRTPVTILGWTDRIPQLLKTHHVVISKAGGATTQEAIAARCPMIVNQIVPGQEEGNYELLRRHGIGALAQTPDAVMAVLRRALAGRGTLWREWRRALEPLAKPTAASDIAQHLVHTFTPPGPVTNGRTAGFTAAPVPPLNHG